MMPDHLREEMDLIGLEIGPVKKFARCSGVVAFIDAREALAFRLFTHEIQRSDETAIQVWGADETVQHKYLSAADAVMDEFQVEFRDGRVG